MTDQGTTGQEETPSGGVSLSLAGINLLRQFPESIRKSLEAKCSFRHVAAGEVLLDRYSTENHVCFLISGAARVVHFVGDHEEFTIATVTGGDTLGEVAAIDGKSRSATIIAEEDCVVAELPQSEFRTLIVRHGEVALSLLTRWAGIIRALDDKISYLSTRSPEQRVYSELIRLARREKPDGDRWLIRDLPSHQELAMWSQTTRESVASAIADLVRRGIAERRTRTLYVNDYGALKDLIAKTPKADASAPAASRH